MTTPQLSADECIDVLDASHGKLALHVDYERVAASYYVHDTRLRMLHSGTTAREEGFDPSEMLRQDVQSERATVNVVHRTETPFENNHE
jgi:hypothetical protein